jgi:hypothetical protein
MNSPDTFVDSRKAKAVLEHTSTSFMQYAFAIEEDFTHGRIFLVVTRYLIISLHVET